MKQFKLFYLTGDSKINMANYLGFVYHTSWGWTFDLATTSRPRELQLEGDRRLPDT